MMHHRIAVVLLAATALCMGTAAQPQPQTEAQPQSCLDLSAPGAKATVSGKLTRKEFAGPPNYESIAEGDAREQALILELAQAICADDGEFIDGSYTFDRVHVSSGTPALLDVLNAAVGREVTLSGEAFGSHTAHHRAPLVLFAQTITVR